MGNHSSPWWAEVPKILQRFNNSSDDRWKGGPMDSWCSVIQNKISSSKVWYVLSFSLLHHSDTNFTELLDVRVFMETFVCQNSYEYGEPPPWTQRKLNVLCIFNSRPLSSYQVFKSLQFQSCFRKIRSKVTLI